MLRIFAISLVAAVAGNLASAQDTVRLATEGAYPPYNFINDSGEIDGFERILGDELCKRAGLNCVWVANDWDSIIPNLQSANYDAIIAAMSITDERDAIIDFSIPYLKPEPSSFVALASSGPEVVGQTVAVQVSTIFSGYVSTSGATMLEFATADEAVAAVRNGEAQATMDYRSRLEPIVAESGGELIFVGADVFLGDGVGMGFRSSDGALREKFNDAIQSMKDDGSLNALIVKWLGEGRAF
jgi:polar amino acid transport system substrate-binding protein